MAIKWCKLCLGLQEKKKYLWKKIVRENFLSLRLKIKKKTKNCIFGERMKKKFNKMWKNDLFKKKFTWIFISAGLQIFQQEIIYRFLWIK